MTQSNDAFSVQRSLRGPWRRYLDRLAEHRPALHAYCRRLTGNVWDGEDLAQDTLVRLFSLMGRSDTPLENPRAYLIRTAANLWIDRVRRSAREQAAMLLEEPLAEESGPSAPGTDHLEQAQPAAQRFFQTLHPQERAAILMKEVLELSLEETAELLHTTVGAVKSALSRARGRLEGRRAPAAFDAPAREIVERFTTALSNKDIATLQELCAEHVRGELVGGVEVSSFARVRRFFEHAHMVMPKLGFGERPWWKVGEYEGEPIVLGFRTLDGIEGLNEVHRLEISEGRIVRVRTYCFCPETLAVVAQALGVPALRRPYRSPSISDFVLAMLGLRAFLPPRS